jgi:two-component system, sensor histidine kinase
LGDGRSELLMIVAPIGRDAELICTQLTSAGLECKACRDVSLVCENLSSGVGAILLTDEALSPESMTQLTKVLAEQPPWSEIPLIILTGAPSLDHRQRSFEELRRRTNVTLVDRPVRINTLVSATQSALRARRRQYEIRDLMMQLEERIHERDRFLAVLGHELRNPLGAILLASQMTEDDGKLAGEHARLIERQSQHLTRLVNDLLDLSRVAAGKIQLKKQHVDLRDVAAQSLRVIAPAAEKQKQDVNVGQPAEPVIIDADPIRVEQIITNLLSNAVKYTPEGGRISLAIGVEGNDAVVQVSDDGVGIDPDRIGGIFELFAQAENAIGRAQGGMGIGLALVRNLVDLHDGKVEARSGGLGQGSSFEVRFPMVTESTAAPQPATPRVDSPSESRHIVIVEDNHDVRDLLGLRLKRLGHKVDLAADGIEGLDLLLRVKPEVALVDLGLPGKDGYEVAREARATLGPDVMLVAVSGFGQPEDKRRAIESGFDEHITKPAELRDIEELLRRLPSRNSDEG